MFSLFRNRYFQVFLTLFALFSFGVLGLEITRIDIRFALMTEEISRYGLHIFPTLNGIEYCDYPSFMVLLAWLASCCGKYVNLWTLSLPSILLGAYTFALTYYAGEEYRKNMGLLASGIMLTVVELLDLFTGFGIDSFVLASGITMLWLQMRNTRDQIRLPLFAILLFFCFAARGPMGLVLLGASVGGYLLAERRWKSVLIYGICGFITTLFCLGLLYWSIHQFRDHTLWESFLTCQLYSRVGKSAPFQNLLLCFFSFMPLSLLLLGVVPVSAGKIKQSPFAGLCGAFLLPLIVMCIPAAVHMRYLLIGVPAAALFTSGLLLKADRLDFIRKILEEKKERIILIETLLLCIGVIATVVIAPFFIPPMQIAWNKPVLALILLICGFFFIRKTALSGLLFFLNIAITVMLVVFPLRAARENSVKFVRMVESRTGGLVYLCHIGPDHDDLKYILPLTPEERAKVRYLFFVQPKISGYYAKMYPVLLIDKVLPVLSEKDTIVITDRKDMNDILAIYAKKAGFRIEEIGKGNLGHRSFLALKLIRQK